MDWLTGGNPLGALQVYQEFYGIPNAAILGLVLGIIIGMIYVHTRSLAHLAVLGLYVVALVGSTFAAEAYVAPQYTIAIYVIAIGITSAVILFVLRLIKE